MILIKHHNEGNYEPYFYFALEDYILNNLLKDDESYFFTWKIEGLVSGKNQVIENEINFPFVKENNIKFFRRPTGGGSVYADLNNTMFSIITKRSTKNFSFKNYLEKITEVFKKLNINLEFSGRNDLTLNGKKISGNAFLQNKNGMLMHGTLMYDLDIETMVRSLTPSDEKLVSKGISSVKSRVTNLKPHLNDMSHDELINFLESNLTNEVYEINPDEVQLLNEKAKYYASDEFLFERQPEYTNILKQRFNWGEIEIRLKIKKGIIENFKLNGDFFDLNDLDTFEHKFIKKRYNFQTIKSILSTEKIDDYILGANNHDLLALFEKYFLKT
ncbi:MAG: lipoate--protein ligase [Acholeplasmataceae bacterium]